MSKLKPLAINFISYTVIMFLADRFFINPGRTIGGHIIFALVSGVLFVVLYALFNKLFTRLNSRQKS